MVKEVMEVMEVTRDCRVKVSHVKPVISEGLDKREQVADFVGERMDNVGRRE
jgi:hypothetical protein